MKKILVTIAVVAAVIIAAETEIIHWKNLSIDKLEAGEKAQNQVIIRHSEIVEQLRDTIATNHPAK